MIYFFVVLGIIIGLWVWYYLGETMLDLYTTDIEWETLKQSKYKSHLRWLVFITGPLGIVILIVFTAVFAVGYIIYEILKRFFELPGVIQHTFIQLKHTIEDD